MLLDSTVRCDIVV